MCTVLAFSTSFLDSIVERDEFIGLLAIVSGTFIAVIAIIFTCSKGVLISRQKETTKRELAAYVAEGALPPEKAVAIIEAGKDAEEV